MASTLTRPLGALYLDFEPYLAGVEAGRELEPVEQGRDGVEILEAVDLGDDHGVERVAGRLDDLDQVAIEGRGVEGVGAVERRPAPPASPAPPVELLYSPGDRLASASLLVRGDGVIEVKEYRVGFGEKRLLDRILVECVDR